MGGAQPAPASWLPFFEWLEATSIGTAVRESIWAFPVIEAVHLLGLGMLGGAVLVVDLRLLGTGLTRTPVDRLVGQARPWLVAALVVMVATGVPLFLSEAVKCYYNTSYWVKMLTLPVAIVFTFRVRRRLVRSGTRDTTGVTKLLGAASIALWFVVAAAGRWIGFSG